MSCTRTTGLPILLLTALIAAGILGCAETPPPAPVPVPPAVPVAPDAPASDPARDRSRQVHLEIFADDRDPDTAAFLKELDAALAKAFPSEQLRRRVLNPDDQTNYKRLTAFENASGTKQFAPVEAFLTVVQDFEGPDPHLTAASEPPPPPLKVDATGFIEPQGHPLALIGKEAISARLQSAIRVLLQPNKGMLSVAQPEQLQAAAERLLTKADVKLKLPADFPGAINPRANGVVKTWEVVWPPDDEPVLVVKLALLYQPIDCPVCTDTELLVLMQDDKIHGVEAIRPIERYGEAIPAEAAKFLAQFERQRLDGDLAQRLEKVDGIAGASKTVTNVKTLLSNLVQASQPSKP